MMTATEWRQESRIIGVSLCGFPLLDHLDHIRDFPKATRDIPDALEAEPMLEGMGSLRFSGPDNPNFGCCIAEAEFRDADGVPVSAALNLDQFGEIIELDLFKADYSPVQRIPPADELRNSK